MAEVVSSTEPAPKPLIVAGEFLLDRETIRVGRGSKPLQLSLKQFRLPEVFMEHPGEPLPRRTLKQRVWGSSSTIEESTIDAEILRLRRVIGGRQREAPIRTVRKSGYVFQIPQRRRA